MAEKARRRRGVLPAGERLRLADAPAGVPSLAHGLLPLWRYGLEEKPRGFQVPPRRWVVERAFAWLGQARRLAKDYERLRENAAAMILWAMNRVMLRRLAGAARRNA